MKLLRNHLIDDGLRLPGGGLIDSQLFADVLAIDKGKEFRILPRLGTESHLRVRILIFLFEILSPTNKAAYVGSKHSEPFL